MLDLEATSTTGLSVELGTGALSPVEVTIAFLERIDRFNEELGAYITVCGDRALESARSAERMSPEERKARPLHGVPFAVKDQLLTQGVETTAGSEVLRGFVPSVDATAVARVTAAGGILLGKLNMTQFAAGMDDRYPYLEPRNPWDLTRTPGNSSGGAAIAVAASLASFTLGEDTGGSIREPASYCGITGLRPSWGRVSRYGLLPFCWSMDTVGPMCRTVGDASMVLGVIAGHDERDASSSRQVVPDYAKPSGQLAGRRAALVEDWLDPHEIDPEVRTAIVNAADIIEAMGVTIEMIRWPRADDLAPVVNVIGESDAAYVHRDRLRLTGDRYGNNIRRRLLAASLLPSQVVQKAVRLRAVFRREWLDLLSHWDFVLSPTTPRTAPRIAYLDDGIRTIAEAEAKFMRVRSARHPATIAGTPALSIPCGFSTDGLPIGLQIMTRPFEEHAALDLATAYEKATSWHTRRPPLKPTLPNPTQRGTTSIS